MTSTLRSEYEPLPETCDILFPILGIAKDSGLGYCRYEWAFQLYAVYSNYCFGYNTSYLSSILHLLQHTLQLTVHLDIVRMLTWFDRPTSFRTKHATRKTSFGKQERDILEFEPFGLGIEEIDHRDEGGVEDGEDNKRPPSDVSYHDKWLA